MAGRGLRWRYVALGLLLGGVGALVPAAAHDRAAGLAAAMAPQTLNDDADTFYRGIVMDESELAELRGGFNIAGMQLDFGAELRTLIDNQVQLVTQMTFSRAGEMQIVSQSFSDATGKATQVGPGSGVSITDITPDGVNLAGLADFTGVTLRDGQDFTAALHNITQNAIMSSVISNASGKDIQQAIDISVNVSNVGQLRAAKHRAAIFDSLSGVIR